MSFEVFYNNKTQINDLIEKYQQGNLVLALGAGVSINYNIPDWNLLLKKLLAKVFSRKYHFNKEESEAYESMFSNIYQANQLSKGRFIQKYYEEINKQFPAFEEDVKNILYENIIIKNADTIEKISELCISDKFSPKLNSIITYNYDDILEENFRIKDINFKFKSIYKADQKPKHDELAIYHVHGFLPKYEDISLENKITLGENAYHDQYNQIYSWQNLVQINKFRENSCLFVGSSLTDPNIRRLMDIASMNKASKDTFHYVFKKRIRRNDIKSTLNISNEDEINNINEISNILEKITNIMNDFEISDMESLGVKPIFIDDYNKDIPQILKRIKMQQPIIECVAEKEIIKEIIIKEGLTIYDRLIMVYLKKENPENYSVTIMGERLMYYPEYQVFCGVIRTVDDNEITKSSVHISYI